MKKLKVYWPFLPLLLFVVAGIVGWFVLPAELVMQSGGETTVPKLVGLLVPVALSALGGSFVAVEKRRWAGVVVLIVAAAAEILLFVWNL